jgi:uncharacterized integral membrane protein
VAVVSLLRRQPSASSVESKWFVMSRLFRTRIEANGQLPAMPTSQPPAAGVSAPAEPAQPTEQVPPPSAVQPQATQPARVPRTRTGSAWVALIAAALLAVLLIVFLVQNTRSTEISFLWMTTSTPLAVALLIAAVGSVLLTLILGTARIAQLRRLVRKDRR